MSTELKKQSAFTTPVPPVSKKLMHRAFTLYKKDIRTPASDVKRTGVCASLTLGPLVSPGKPRSGSRKFMALANRFNALYDLMVTHKEQIVRVGIPEHWIDLAATAPLTIASGFDLTQFIWPEQEEHQ